MDNNTYNAVEEAKAVALWRARSRVELARLRALIHDVAPLAVYRDTDNSLVLVFTTLDATEKTVSVSITEFPCVAAHLQCYGDDEIVSLLNGQMSSKNLPKYLNNVSTPAPWFHFMLCFAELTAPGERSGEH